jgi:hypothetical protein
MSNQIMGVAGKSISRRPEYIRTFIEAKDGRKERIDKLDNSIANLAPHSFFTTALNRSMWNPDIQVHSVIGDYRQAGATNGTDKVVEYWSSHLDGAVSEVVVKTDHLSLHKETPAISEVRRILVGHINGEMKNGRD